ncbi:unnamed protein product [Oppiella nova]|uniref:Choline kinase n=1 Tax=Oppiella nova TaxID=334625 RepID=A0A7R9QFG5_9ACAR|nr:unnamed protein product [Oppiella nova]CAG2164693.1 unnamed protein product [Oppiella nova]
MTEIFRGQTPEDIDNKCLTICAKYLEGVWKTITINGLDINRISGGFTNQLFHCRLKDNIQVNGNEPKDVFIRLYGPKWVKSSEPGSERLLDAIINVLASEYNLGPKVYGIFDEGILGEYIHGHHMSIEDQKNPILVKEFAQKLAKFHSLNVPTARDLNRYKKIFYDFYDGIYKRTPNLDQIFKEINAKNFLECDIKEENQWLHKCIEAIKSPIVYSHNDIFTGNILVNNKIDDKSANNVILIDFEYSGHFYRGSDLGFFVNEFGRSSNWLDRQDVPLAHDIWIQMFLTHYLNESIEIHGKEFADRVENSMQYLLRETKLFSLIAEMFIIFFMLYTNESPDCTDRREYLKKLDVFYGRYIKRRQQFEKEGIVPLSRH